MKKVIILILCLVTLIGFILLVSIQGNPFSDGDILGCIEPVDFERLDKMIDTVSNGKKCSETFTRPGFEGSEFKTIITYNGSKIKLTYIVPAQETQKGSTAKATFDKIYKVGTEYHLKNKSIDIRLDSTY